MNELALEGKLIRLARKTNQGFDFAGYNAHLRSIYYYERGIRSLSDEALEINEAYMKNLKWEQRKVFHKLLLHDGSKDLAEYFEQKYLIPKFLKT
ncbi:hypothetical protein J4480_04170 [Candidatus Woesearchaeota archaeon]|nr:hypothetical protein [Candidatus Woesearchaeota archaeon]